MSNNRTVTLSLSYSLNSFFPNFSFNCLDKFLTFITFALDLFCSNISDVSYRLGYYVILMIFDVIRLLH